MEIIPSECHRGNVNYNDVNGSPTTENAVANSIFYQVKQGGTRLGKVWAYEQYSNPVIVKAGQYSAGTPIQISVYYEYYAADYGREYTVKLYSKDTSAYIKDSENYTNMIHMDGHQPSGFTYSTYSV